MFHMPNEGKEDHTPNQARGVFEGRKMQGIVGDSAKVQIPKIHGKLVDQHPQKQPHQGMCLLVLHGIGFTHDKILR